ncbi:MAG: ATP-binding cassette domain-containing protein [Actinomycetota bacterium]|nr:ATP-binding cassette domain-containing protein [Actinomycetota bacterium]
MTATEARREVVTHLRLEGVTAGYGGPPVIRDVCIGVERGRIAVVAGPNGAGKSTLVKAIMGQLKVTGGSVHLADRNITNDSAERIARHGIGYVPQSQDVFEDLTVWENLEIGGYLLSKKKSHARALELLELFPPLARMRSRAVGQLSGGERKMVAVGRVLMLEPSVLILDEPTAGLSVPLTEELFEVHVRALADAGTAVLLVEQKATEALRVADWGYILVSGAVEVSQPAQEILGRADIGEVFLGGSTSVVGEGDEEE